MQTKFKTWNTTVVFTNSKTYWFSVFSYFVHVICSASVHNNWLYFTNRIQCVQRVRHPQLQTPIEHLRFGNYYNSIYIIIYCWKLFVRRLMLLKSFSIFDATKRNVPKLQKRFFSGNSKDRKPATRMHCETDCSFRGKVEGGSPCTNAWCIDAGGLCLVYCVECRWLSY